MRCFQSPMAVDNLYENKLPIYPTSAQQKTKSWAKLKLKVKPNPNSNSKSKVQSVSNSSSNSSSSSNPMSWLASVHPNVTSKQKRKIAPGNQFTVQVDLP